MAMWVTICRNLRLFPILTRFPRSRGRTTRGKRSSFVWIRARNLIKIQEILKNRALRGGIPRKILKSGLKIHMRLSLFTKTQGKSTHPHQTSTPSKKYPDRPSKPPNPTPKPHPQKKESKSKQAPKLQQRRTETMKIDI
jgi:hypothetical protein